MDWRRCAAGGRCYRRSGQREQVEEFSAGGDCGRRHNHTHHRQSDDHGGEAMKRQIRFLLLAVAVAPIANAQFELFQVNGNVEISVAPLYDFGAVYAGEAKSIQFRLRNTSSTPNSSRSSASRVRASRWRVRPFQ